MIINPAVHLSAEVVGTLTIKLAVIELTFRPEILFGKLTPVDWQFAWDLDEKSEYCQSLGWSWEVLDLKVMTEYYINECSFGALGGTFEALKIGGTQSYKDCTWRRYEPQLPVYLVTLQDQGDQAVDFIPWSCSYYNELETTDASETATKDENGNDIDNPIGFDDLPEEEEEVVWEYDPSNVVTE